MPSMPSAVKRKLDVFLDSNIFVAAVLSSSGGSFRLLQKARAGRIIIYTSSFVMDEVARVLFMKYPAHLHYGPKLIASTPLLISSPSEKEIDQTAPLVDDPDDAPILAGALKSKAQFLITLDRKHFITHKLANAKLPVAILTPREFFTEYLD